MARTYYPFATPQFVKIVKEPEVVGPGSTKEYYRPSYGWAIGYYLDDHMAPSYVMHAGNMHGETGYRVEIYRTS